MAFGGKCQFETRSTPSMSLGSPKFMTSPVFSFLSRRYVRHCAAWTGLYAPALHSYDNEIVNKDVDAKRMFGIAQVMSLVDDWTRRFKPSLVAAGLKLIGESTLIDLFKDARSANRLVDFYGTGDNVFGDVGVFPIVAFHAQIISNEPTHGDNPSANSDVETPLPQALSPRTSDALC